MKKLLLIVPSLHQGGLEKVCAATARLLQPYFDVQIAILIPAASPTISRAFRWWICGCQAVRA